MHDPHHGPNGHPSWAPPSPWDIMIGMLRQIDARQMEHGSRLGGLEHGQKIGLENDREIFEQVHEIRDRVTTLEVLRRPAGTEAASPPPPPGLLASLTDLIKALGAAVPSVKDLVAAIAVLLAALAAFPDRKPPNASAPAPPELAAPSAP